MVEQAAKTGIVVMAQVVESARDADSLRSLALEVREFLEQQVAEGSFVPCCDSWIGGWDVRFSQALAARGWIGLTIPKRYGGGGRSQVERVVVTEELLAAGAPVAAHWVTERQIAPMFVAVGTDEQRERFLPLIARAEISFALGMSEPESGSDLASVRTRAVRAEGGWLLSGQKIWSTSAHRSDYMVVLCRTSQEGRHAGLSQLIVDLRAPGVEVRSIAASIGDDEFNEVFFDEVFVPDQDVLGRIGDGWRQITTELGYERGGPERFMSNVPLLQEFARKVPSDPLVDTQVGELVARIVGLRALVMSVAAGSDDGQPLSREAALAKDAGNMFEQDTVEVLHRLGCPRDDVALEALMNRAIAAAPTVTLRGGTTEILRGIIAKDLAGIVGGGSSRPGTLDGRSSGENDLLADAVERFLGERCTPEFVAAVEAGEDPSTFWNEVEDLGFTLTSVPEAAGGSGGSLSDALTLLQAVGRHAVPLPLAETMIAGWLLAEAGLQVPNGPLTLAPVRAGEGFRLDRNGTDFRISGRALRIPWARSASRIVVVARDEKSALYVAALEPSAARITRGTALTQEPRDIVDFDAVEVDAGAVSPLSVSWDVIQTRGALFRASMMLGALERARRLTVAHASSRTQFGRPIVKFQAVQQLIAQIAREVALTRAAVGLAAAAVADDPVGGQLEVGAAKIVAGRATGSVSAWAHQVHGAMGVTKEYPLSALTRRLWCWRAEFGSEAEWSRLLGSQAWRAKGGPWGLATSTRMPIFDSRR